MFRLSRLSTGLLTATVVAAAASGTGLVLTTQQTQGVSAQAGSSLSASGGSPSVRGTVPTHLWVHRPNLPGSTPVQLLRARRIDAGAAEPGGAAGQGPRATAGHSDAELAAIATSGSDGIPAAALRAYRHAGTSLASSDPSCHLPWTLLAAIGRVESDHGRFGGSVLGSDGVARPGIYGPVVLGGTRAVGPMQFLPSTWASLAGDGDGDGVTNPQDIDDAALGAGLYLCRYGDLSTTAGMAGAAFGYNHSSYYVDLVLAYERGYRTGVFTIPSPPPSSSGSSPGTDKPAVSATPSSTPPSSTPRPTQSTRPTPSSPASTGPAPTTAPSPKPSPGQGGSPSATPTPTSAPPSTAPSPSTSGAGTGTGPSAASPALGTITP